MRKDTIKELQQSITELRMQLEALQYNSHHEELLNSYDMEKLLKCSSSKLYRLRRDGKLPCVLVGRIYMYPKSLLLHEIINSITKNEDPSKRFDDPK